MIERGLPGALLALFLIALLGVGAACVWAATSWNETHWRYFVLYHEQWRSLALTATGLLAGVAGLFTLYNSARRSRTMVEQRDIERDRADTERLEKVVGLLGQSDIYVRIGAIHILIDMAECAVQNSRTPRLVYDVLMDYVQRASLDESRQDDMSKLDLDVALDFVTDPNVQKRLS